MARAVTMVVQVAVSGGDGGFGGGSGGDEGKGRGVGGGALYSIVPVKNILIYRHFSYMKLT